MCVLTELYVRSDVYIAYIVCVVCGMKWSEYGYKKIKQSSTESSQLATNEQNKI